LHQKAPAAFATGAGLGVLEFAFQDRGVFARTGGQTEDRVDQRVDEEGEDPSAAACRGCCEQAVDELASSDRDDREERFVERQRARVARQGARFARGESHSPNRWARIGTPHRSAQKRQLAKAVVPLVTPQPPELPPR
jgi:hypothetical protein